MFSMIKNIQINKMLKNRYIRNIHLQSRGIKNLTTVCLNYII